MDASFVDFRKKSAEIIKALGRNEPVTLYYRGKPAGIVNPVGAKVGPDSQSTSSHPAFGLWADRDDEITVEEQMKQLRRGRFDDL